LKGGDVDGFHPDDVVAAFFDFRTGWQALPGPMQIDRDITALERFQREHGLSGE
jgi:hypothetical protein